MYFDNLLLFGLAVFPLVCTPGPDVLFIASQGLTAGKKAVMKANAGILTGYCVHAVLSALGVAALVAASPILFNVIRWVGIAYLLYLAFCMIRSAMKKGLLEIQKDAKVYKHLYRKGFLTSFLNPKGLLIYLAILPNFIDKSGNYGLQALSLAAVFIVSCAIVYTIIGVSLANLSSKSVPSDKRRRLVEGFSGSLLIIAAGFIAGN
jgi:threonine/homoserine/homoserine lactone efflux protein